MINAIIIDDIPQARAALRTDIEDHCPDIRLIGEADGVETGWKLIAKMKPDLVFLDIQMNDGTGFDLLRKCSDKNLKVIFTTAFDQFAIQAFKFSAVDYLLKPVDPEDLKAAVEKFRESGIQSDLSANYTLLAENIRDIHKKTVKKIALNTQDRVHIVPISQIVRCESHSNYTLFYLADSKKILVTRTLKEFDDMLTPFHFVRVHHSHLMNLDFLKEFIKSDGGYALMNDGSQVPVSARKREALLKRLSEL